MRTLFAGMEGIMELLEKDVMTGTLLLVTGAVLLARLKQPMNVRHQHLLSLYVKRFVETESLNHLILKSVMTEIESAEMAVQQHVQLKLFTLAPQLQM